MITYVYDGVYSPIGVKEKFLHLQPLIIVNYHGTNIQKINDISK